MPTAGPGQGKLGKRPAGGGPAPWRTLSVALVLALFLHDPAGTEEPAAANRFAGPREIIVILANHRLEKIEGGTRYVFDLLLKDLKNRPFEWEIVDYEKHNLTGPVDSVKPKLDPPKAAGLALFHIQEDFVGPTADEQQGSVRYILEGSEEGRDGTTVELELSLNPRFADTGLVRAREEKEEAKEPKKRAGTRLSIRSENTGPRTRAARLFEFKPRLPHAPEEAPRRYIIADYPSRESYLKPSARRILNRAAKILENNLDLAVRLEARAYDRKDERYNLVLSELRAVVAKKYLISRGIDQERIITVAYGNTKPLSMEEAAMLIRATRRLESIPIGILEKKQLDASDNGRVNRSVVIAIIEQPAP